METNTINKTADGACQFGHLTYEVAKAHTVANEFIEDGKRTARRTAKRAVIAVEECVEDTSYYIKRHPWQSVGLAAGFGVGAGLLARWVLSRAAQGCTENGSAEFQAVER